MNKLKPRRDETAGDRKPKTSKAPKLTDDPIWDVHRNLRLLGYRFFDTNKVGRETKYVYSLNAGQGITVYARIYEDNYFSLCSNLSEDGDSIAIGFAPKDPLRDYLKSTLRVYAYALAQKIEAASERVVSLIGEFKEDR